MIRCRIHILVLVWMVILASAMPVTAQECVSQGDPIVHIDFGIGTPDFGLGTRTYQRNQVGYINDGEFKIASNIQQGRSEWHNLGDASTDPDGMMLVVNASYEPGEFYRIRVDDLCADTRFVFSANIANANQPGNCGELVLPNVRFVIEDLDGNVVNQYSTGDISASTTPQWLEFSFPFNTGNQHSFYLVLINDNPGGCGNDLAIDNIRFAPCGPEVMLESAWGYIGSDTLYYCAQQTTPIMLKGALRGNGSADFAYQWQTRQGTGAWQDMEGETNETVSVNPVPGIRYRLAVAADQGSMAINGCRFMSPVVTLQAARDVQGFDGLVTHKREVCEGSEVLLRSEVEIPGYYGHVRSKRWDVDVNGVWLEVSRDDDYQVRTDGMEGFRFRHVAEMACGSDLVTDIFEGVVREWVAASLSLPNRTACIDGDPIPLSGGSLSAVRTDLIGEYDGPGVVDGQFYPSLAGMGSHVIHFGPPNSYPCSEMASDIIEVVGAPALSPMADVRVRRGGRATLDPQTDGTLFRWSGGDGLDAVDIRNPVVSPSATTTYHVEVRNEAGCRSTGTVTVIVLPDLIIPNAFTPNGDGVNDNWQIDGIDLYTSVSIQVFNRWGTLVFVADERSATWDGRHQNEPLPAGTYYYIITADQLHERVSGPVSILR